MSVTPQTLASLGEETLYTIPYEGAHTLPPPHTPADAEQNGKTTPEVTLKEVIGSGGMGVVHLAEQAAPRRRVAVKRSRSSRSDGAPALLHEAMLAGALEHPNIVPIHMVLTDVDSGPQVVMKYIEGHTLQTLIGKAPVADDALRKALSHLIQVCRALEYAHSRGIVHRDVKPANIMIGDFGEVYLLDWGVAVDLNGPPPPTQVVGTPAYMAPEMVDGRVDSIDPRTDVYLLGATLHHLLTGQPRHCASTVSEALRKATRSERVPYATGVSAELANLCNRACAADPADRPATVTAFRNALEHHLEHWQAMKLVDLANAERERLHALIDADAASTDVRAQFDRVSFAYGQALHIWEACSDASTGLHAVQSAMVAYFLETEQLDNAADLLNRMQDVAPELQARFKLARTEKDREASEAARLQALGSKNDPVAVQSAQRVLAIVATVLSALFAVVVMSPVGTAGFEDAQVLFSVTAVMFTPMLLCIWLFRQRLAINVHGRRAVLSVGSAMAGIVIHRGLGAHYGQPAFEIILIDLLLIGTATVNAAPSLRSGPFIAAVALCCIPFSMVVPAGIPAAGLLMCIVMGGALLYEWVIVDRFRGPPFSP